MLSKAAIPLYAAVLLFAGLLQTVARTEFDGSFAAVEDFVNAPEKPYREDFCLNGLWQFQPVSVPEGWKPDTGIPPALAPADPQHWEKTPIKIPSPWNVNTWGNGRNAGEGTSRPYVADSVYYPSYPTRWDGERMGWLRRTFRLPPEWSTAGRRFLLRFEAVAGETQVFVNGFPVGNHFDAFLPFELDVTERVRAGEDNELLVGIRQSELFDVVTPGYPVGQRRTYPNGSNMDHLVGIWNDVFLVAVPEVRTEDVFIRPKVTENLLALDLTLRNDGEQEKKVRIGGQISPWFNEAGHDALDAPLPRWKLGASVLSIGSEEITLPPGSSLRVTREVKVRPGTLQFWSPTEPNLYGLVLETDDGQGTVLDRRYVRFGWREFKLRGRDLLLNGQPLQLFGDFCHPFGPFIGSRRYAWADYRMIKDFGGNMVRPHAQPMPRFWLDLADEMGICVLDESAIFGSSVSLNLHEPTTWTRLEKHVDDLVRRDRNHPGVFGWSPANEMFALFLHTSSDEKQVGYARLKELAQRPRRLDPTREWLSFDGDKDLDGSLPVWSSHYGIGIPSGADLPDLDKPRMIGEHGGTYFAAPPLLMDLNGNRAFQNYAGRDEALAADLYRMVVQCAKPKLTAFSPSELVWFGLEHLPYGYRDDTRPPGQQDGVFFPRYVEGVPGAQIERLPPYVATLNPGFDPTLPLYKPLAMFDAFKAALDRRGPQPGVWDHVSSGLAKAHPVKPMAVISKVAFLGDHTAFVYQRLSALGVPLARVQEAGDCALLIIDGETITAEDMTKGNVLLDATLHRGGMVWVMLQEKGAGLPHLDGLLGDGVILNSRRGTSLVHAGVHPALAPLELTDLYFAEEKDPYVQKSGLAGAWVAQSNVLLNPSDTDWSLFERQPESCKCSSVEIYERLHKPPGPALAEQSVGPGKVWVSTLDVTVSDPVYDRFWKQIFTNLGVTLGASISVALPPPGDAQKPHDLLLDGPPK